MSVARQVYVDGLFVLGRGDWDGDEGRAGQDSGEGEEARQGTHGGEVLHEARGGQAGWKKSKEGQVPYTPGPRIAQGVVRTFGLSRNGPLVTKQKEG